MSHADISNRDEKRQGDRGKVKNECESLSSSKMES